MSAWPTTVLGDVFEIARGGSPRPIDDFITDDPAGINWIMISDASEGSKYISSTKKRIRPEGVKRSRQVKPGDFLLTNSMSFGKPYIMRTHGCIHDGWLVLSPRSGNVDADFFYHLLGSNDVYAEFERRASGATVKNLNIDLVRGVRVPFPPLSEQRRIAAILDNADALRANRRAALTQLDILIHSIFLDMFGDPATNPKRWPMHLVEDVAEIVSGATPKTEVPDFWDGDVNWVAPRELSGLRGIYINRTERRITDAGLRSCAATVLPVGAVLFSSRAPIGHTAICGIPMATNQGFKSFVPKPTKLDSHFLLHWLRLRRRWLEGLGTGATFKEVSKAVVARIQIAVPPLGLQREFAGYSAAIEVLRDRQWSAGEELDGLFSALQERAFGGEL